MIELSLPLLVLLVSALVVLFLLLVIILVFKVKSRNRDRSGAQQLADQVSDKSEQRQQIWSTFLQERFGLEGDDVRSAVERIDLTEKRFFHSLLQVYLRKDTTGLANFDSELDVLSETYRSLIPEKIAAPVNDDFSDTIKIQTAQIETLEEQNQQLTEELSITKETMSSMIQEFGNMFGGGPGHGMDSEDVLGRMSERTQEVAARIAPGEYELGDDSGVEIEMDEIDDSAADANPDDLQESMDSAVEIEEVVELSAEPEEPDVNPGQKAELTDDDINALLK